MHTSVPDTGEIRTGNRMKEGAVVCEDTADFLISSEFLIKVFWEWSALDTHACYEQ
jgi:hypothetical protein